MEADGLLSISITKQVEGKKIKWKPLGMKWSTRLHSRGSTTRVPPTSRGAPFPPPSSRGRILSLRGRERIPGVPVASQEEALSTGKARGTAGSCHHSLSPPDVSVHSRETCFPCTASTFKRRIDSTTVARGTALWESLVGKPLGKASRESHRSLDPREGKRDTADTAREESARAWPHSRRGLTPLGRLTFRGTPFPPGSSKWRILSCLVRKVFSAFPWHLKRMRSPQERREELQGRATIPSGASASEESKSLG